MKNKHNHIKKEKQHPCMDLDVEEEVLLRFFLQVMLVRFIF